MKLRQKNHHQTKKLKKTDFDRIFTSAQFVIRKPPFLLLGVKNLCHRPRLGLVVAKRYTPKAVDRNLVKRLCREQFHNAQKQLISADFVLLYKGVSGVCSKRELNKKISKIFHQLTQSHHANSGKGGYIPH